MKINTFDKCRIFPWLNMVYVNYERVKITILALIILASPGVLFSTAEA